jgi:hypothetical protein
MSVNAWTGLRFYAIHSREEKRRGVEPYGDRGVDTGEPGPLRGRLYFGKGHNLSCILCR